MPVFKTLKQATRYGIKNYFSPEYTETIHGNWDVRDQYNEIKYDPKGDE